MGVLAQVLLGDLQFHQQRRTRHPAEQRMERLAWLEIERAILRLNQDIVAEGAVQRFEFVHRLHDTVGGARVGVDECAPHHDAPVRRERVRQHVRAVGVGAVVVLRAWLPLGVGLDDKAAEVRNRPIDLVGLRCPPGTDARVQGIGRGQSPNLDRRAEPGSQIHLDAVGAKDAGEGRNL